MSRWLPKLKTRCSVLWLPPVLLFAVGGTGQIRFQHVFAVQHGMGELVGQQRAQVRAGLHPRIEIQHVAVIAERRRQLAVEVGAAHEAAQRHGAALQLAQYWRQQDRELAVAVDVVGAAEMAARPRKDLVVEAVPERLELKTALFRELDGICSPQTLFATNTSS